MKKDERIFEEVKRRYNQVAWTHKINEKQADIYATYNRTLNIVLIVLDAITTGGILKLFNSDLIFWKIVTAVSSTLVLILNSLKAINNLSELSAIYKKYANKFLVIRNKLESLLTLYDSNNISTDEMIKRFEKVDSELNELYKEAPSTTDLAVSKADKAFFINEDNFISDREKEKILPEHLNKGK